METKLKNLVNESPSIKETQILTDTEMSTNTFMKTTLSLLIFITSFFGLSAQNVITIKGKITDNTGKPITLAAVSLFDTDSRNLVSGGTTNSEGTFSLNATPDLAAMLKVEHIVFEADSLFIHSLKDTVINITLFPKSYLLGEVTVTGSRPKYKIKSDGNMVVNVERIPGFETSNVFELMQKLPGVVATDDKGILLNAKSVEVLVDGRSMSYMNVLTLLKSLPAYSLDEIELISIKGAEHDGTAQAIIDLKTKQQRWDGYFGNVSAGGRIYSNHSYVDIGNVFFMIKSKKIAINSTLGYDDYKVKASGTENTYLGNSGKTIDKTGNQQDKERHLTWNSTLSWNIAKKQYLYANLSLFGSQLDREEAGNYLNNLTGTNVYTIAGMDAPRTYISGNVEYRLSTLLKIYYGYVRGRSNYDEQIENTYRTDSIVPILHDENNLESQHVSKADFRKQYRMFTLKAGLKGLFSKQDNRSLYTASVPLSYQNIDFTANENIVGGYAGLDYKISSQIDASVSLRSEYTAYSLENRNIAGSSKPDYWNLFPVARVTMKLLPWYTFSSYFNSSVIRPHYQYLLPGKRYLNDYNYTEGNPYLKPSQRYTIGLDNMFWGFVNLYINATEQKDIFARVKADKGNGLTANTYMNAIDSRTINIGLSAPFSFIGEKLSGNINVTMETGKYLNNRNGFTLPVQRKRPESLKTTGFFNYQLTSSIGFTANVYYVPMNKTLQTEYDAYATVDFGVNMRLLKSKRLSVSLNVVDVLDSKKNRYEMYYDNNLFVSNIKIPSQYVGLVVSYRFNGGKQFNPQINAEGNDTERFTK